PIFRYIYIGDAGDGELNVSREGKVDRMALLESEAASYHAPGTCTFYGTANTNQMVVEFMGMQLPGSSFVHPDSPLRDALTAAITGHACNLTRSGSGQSIAQ
ncbi:dihydroxy-acid dehydratase domain-containing protein, partial [Escherichia sp. HC-TM1]